MPDLFDLERMEKIIHISLGPVFLIGGIVAFIAVMIGRMNSIIERSRSLNAIAEDDATRRHLRADIPRLVQRAEIINRGILLAIASAVCVTLLILISFAAAFLHLAHVPAAALFYAIALVLLAAALIYFAREVRLALSKTDFHH